MDDNQVSAQIFSGSLTILAIFIAVVGLLLGYQDQLGGVSYLAVKIKNMIGQTAALAFIAATAASLSLARMRGHQVPMPLIVALTYGLIILTAGLTISIAFL